MKAILVSADFLVFELFASFFSSLYSVTVTLGDESIHIFIHIQDGVLCSNS